VKQISQLGITILISYAAYFTSACFGVRALDVDSKAYSIEEAT